MYNDSLLAIKGAHLNIYGFIHTYANLMRLFAKITIYQLNT